ncbi:MULTISPECIES: MarR family transcriptional regulator [Halomicrobium]|uniref:MarR family transcriptional regulator n=1 Tax=Halomicrobium TaxID=203135 RepID=UPI001CDA12CE|nr:MULTISPECIES: helix-turn-helix domain-containing protein [Halomicrobium]
MSATELSGTSEAPEDGWDAVSDLPPSAKLVAKVLEYEDTLTQSQLADETLLPARTVRYALNRLEEVGVVDSRFSFADARKRVYTLTIES